MVTKNDIDNLVLHLAAMFPAWRQAIGNDQEAANFKRVWFGALQDEGITASELERGVKRCRQSGDSFMPSLGQFLAWCRGQECLTKHQAWQTAQLAGMGRVDDERTAEAVRRTGRGDIQNRPERDVRPLFFDHYEDVCREAAAGARFEALPGRTDQPALPGPPRKLTDADAEAARNQLDLIYDMLDKGGPQNDEH